MVVTHLKDTYSSGNYKNCIKNNCKEKGARLKDIPRYDHLILDGDEIEKCKKRCQPLPSCDCIILKNPYHGKILFVELRTGNCNLSKLIAKFTHSTEEILSVLEEVNSDSHSLHHVLLGSIGDSGLKKNPGFKIKGKYCFIDVKPSISSLKDIKKFH
jgi:hypothetical protein